MLYPSDFEHKTDFSTIRLILKEKCISSLGKERVDAITFSTDFDDVTKQISQTDEMLRLMQEATEALPVGDFFEIGRASCRERV